MSEGYDDFFRSLKTVTGRDYVPPPVMTEEAKRLRVERNRKWQEEEAERQRKLKEEEAARISKYEEAVARINGGERPKITHFHCWGHWGRAMLMVEDSNGNSHFVEAEVLRDLLLGRNIAEVKKSRTYHYVTKLE
jgi:hypothetical protein